MEAVMSTKLPLLAGLLLCIAVARAQQPASETYRWFGELVSFDEATKTVTVKSRLAYQEAADALKRFKAGDRVLFMWSGTYDYTDAIRQVTAYAADHMARDRFLLPVELVSTDTPNQYVTFRV